MKKQLLLFIALFSFLNTFSQTEKEKVEATVQKSTIESQIYFLADDLLKGRDTGTPENKIAASYIANTLRGYGVKQIPQLNGYFQKIKLQKVSPIKNMNVTINNKKYNDILALKSEKLDYNGQAIYIGYGLKEDYKNKDVAGKIVIVKAGDPNADDVRTAFGLLEQKENLAKDHGAAAVIEFVQTNKTVWGYLENNFNTDRVEIAQDETEKDNNKELTYLWLQDEDGSHTKELESAKNLKVSLNLSGENKTPIISQNVVGMLQGTDPVLKNQYIIYSAHYDHLGIGKPDATGDSIYNGARDNALGVSNVLSMAQNIAQYPTKRSALFILFTGEEKGLLGSKYYVENPVLPLKQMVYCFNSDGGGYNDKSLITIIGLDRTSEAQNLKTASAAFGLKPIGDPVPEEGLFDRSDNVMFAAKGIPAPTFSPGFTGFTGDVDKYYHQAGDSAESLDYDYLLKFFQAYVLSGRLIADDPKTPAWNSGDKYEEAGKALYGN